MTTRPKAPSSATNLPQEEMPAGSWLTPHWQRDWEVRITNDRVTVLPALEHGG